MQIRIDYNKEEQIFYKFYEGEINVEDVILSWKKNIESREIPEESIGFILDYTNAEMKFKDGHHKIPEFYKDNIETFGGKSIAIITTTPQNTVYPYLISMEDSGYISRPFSSIETARKWIKNFKYN